MDRGILVVQTEAVAGRDAEFNDWYDNVHIPEVLTESGFTAARRFRLISHDSAGSPVGDGDAWQYLALYEVEADDLVEAFASVQARTLSPSDAVRHDLPDRVRLFAQISAHRCDEHTVGSPPGGRAQPTA